MAGRRHADARAPCHGSRAGDLAARTSLLKGSVAPGAGRVQPGCCVGLACRTSELAWLPSSSVRHLAGLEGGEGVDSGAVGKVLEIERLQPGLLVPVQAGSCTGNTARTVGDGWDAVELEKGAVA